MTELNKILIDVFYKIDSSEKTNYVLALFQLFATLAGFFYYYYKDSQIGIAGGFLYAFLFFQFMVFLFFAVMIIISGKYRTIKLHLRRNTGELFDKTTGFTNVSLRSKTLDCIFKNTDNEKIRTVGKNAGEFFYDEFNKVLEEKGVSSKKKAKLKKWLEYDSSSGLGKFEIDEDRFTIRLIIKSNFLGDCPRSHNQNQNNQNNGLNQKCNFLLGYIDGFCSKLYSPNDFSSKCYYDDEQSNCIITVSEVC